MAFREVTMIEVRELLRQHLAGVPKKRIAERVGCDRKTVRSYIDAAGELGVASEAQLTDAAVAAIVQRVRPPAERDFGEAWARCVAQQARITELLGRGVRLSKVLRLLARDGVELPYSTLHRYARDVLGFGRARVTLPVVDGEPGRELQVDTGWVLTLEPDVHGKRRRKRAFIFTPNVSRYRFVYPVERETTETAVQACEAAWEFYGGVFGVLVPDNTKAIVIRASPTAPRITRAFLEYAQARGFVVDPTRARAPRDKGRVERAVRDVRDDCFGGERLFTLAQSFERALRWSRDEYGIRKHTTTQRLPREHFESDERDKLLPAPTERYDVPAFCEPKVGRDHLAQVASAVYSLPTRLIGKRLLARADSATVRFYDGATLVKVHARKPKGGRSIDPSDFPPERTPYAMRDVTLLAKMANEHGDNVGRFARVLLEGPLPWTRMRQVRMLLGLTKKYGDARVDATCALALAADMHDVHRLDNMLKCAAKPQAAPLARVIPIGRYLRPPEQYALALSPSVQDKPQGDT